MNGTVGNHFGSPPTVSGGRSAGTCVHAAGLVNSDDDLLGVALPYLEGGFREGDVVVLACAPRTAELVRTELGAHAARLQLEMSPTEWGLRPPDLLGRVRAFAEQAVGQRAGRLRILAEPLLPPHDEALREHIRMEAATNRVLADVPVTSLCLYDARSAPAGVMDDAGRTHPNLVTVNGWSTSPTYVAPAEFVRRLPRPRDPLEDGHPVFAVDDAPTLPALRHQLGDALERFVADEDLREDLHLALSEVAANAFRHGRPPVSARLWADDIHLVCTITDSGFLFDDPLAGFAPAHGYDLSQGGMGLWLARKLWDHVDLESGPEGFTVRLSTARA